MTTRVAAASVNFILLLVAVDLALSAIFNDTLFINNKITDTRRQRGGKKARSTSSDSNAKDSNDDDASSDDNSLDMTSMSSTSEENKTKNNDLPVSSKERRGWRKWHRKCTPCEEMKLKWRDPAVKWICGGYQRARRSFKSLCMMHYRNCQDGTMFVKIADHRCKNDSERSGWRYGDHFFYEYVVQLRDEDTKSRSSGASRSTQYEEENSSS